MPLCQNQLDFIDGNIRRVESVLDAASEQRVFVEIAIGLPVPGCDPGALGCYLAEVAEVHGYWSAVDHELVHAVAARVGRPSLFWAEGLAEALRGARTEQGSDTVFEGLEDFGGTQAYATAGHFVRWLLETHGEGALRAIAREAELEEAVGISLEEAVALYEAEAPWSYPGDPSRCDFPPLDVDGVGVVAQDIPIGCDELSSTFYLSGATDRTLVLDEAGLFELSFSGGEGDAYVYIYPCQQEALAEPPVEEMLGDVVREEFLGAAPTWFESETVHTVRLEAARYRVIFDDAQSPTEEIEDASLTFELHRVGE